MKVNYNKRIVIVISSPSGAGKTSVCHKLIERDKSIALSISDTTRPARDNEKDGIDYIAFTNSDYLKSDFWDIRKMDTWRNGRWTARKCKTSPQELLPDYDAWLWMDNQLFFTYDPRSLMTHYLTMADISAHFHCDRECIYEETQAALGRRPERDKPETLINQAKQYESEGYPIKNGLFENGILFRRNNEPIRDFNKLWFDETLQGKEDRYWAIDVVNKNHKYLYDGFYQKCNHFYTSNGATWKGIG